MTFIIEKLVKTEEHLKKVKYKQIIFNVNIEQSVVSTIIIMLCPHLI